MVKDRRTGGEIAELRPYGKFGVMIRFDCGQRWR